MSGPKLAGIRMLGPLAFAALLAACDSPDFDYVSRGPSNLTVGVENTSSKRFRNRSSNVAIYYETSPCKFDYAGSIPLANATQHTGLAVGQRVVLQYNFLDLGGQYSSISSIEGIIRVRAGTKYRVDLTYAGDATKVKFRQNGRSRQLPTLADVCPP